MAALSLALTDDKDGYYLHRLIQRLMHRQRAYQVREDYTTGDHPLPIGDPRYARALNYLAKRARTNYIGLAQSAVTDRMRVRTFKFGGEASEEAMKIWKANNMAMNSQIAIKKASSLSDVYALVSPPREEGGQPVITIEDPRVCIVEPDPLDPLQAVVGLKFYEDFAINKVVAILYYPEKVVIFQGPGMVDFLQRETEYNPENIVNSAGGFKKVKTYPNPIGKVPLIRGPWQPEYGLQGMAECEAGGWDIQDRINKGILDRLVIMQSQAYRQRWVTGAKSLKGSGKAKHLTFDPGADMIWAVVDEGAQFGDFAQADLKGPLEATRDDVGDFSAVTQTPVSYLTNKMVNVSGETLTAAQASLVMKIKTRMDVMGWFFEQVMKLCFLYQGNTELANDIEAETMWVDPEMRSMTEIADMVSKFAAASPGFIRIAAERANLTPEEVELVMEEHEKATQMQQEAAMKLAEASKPLPGSNPGSNGSKKPGGSKPAGKTAQKPAAKKPAK